MICQTCSSENRPEARFCDSCGAALVAVVAREQRKVVTVLFCDVAGSTALGERLDPEAMRIVMSSYFEVARDAIERHGGTVEKFIGDAVMAVFGVPVVREDDALRAVRAAVELREGVEIDVRIGVNTGEVVTGTGDTLVTGDAVNVAARLEQAAEPGAVLIGAGTYGLVRDAVDVELVPPLAAKGKTEPLAAYRLRAVIGDVAVARRQDARLVGRERERRLLEDAWARSRSESACSLFTVLGTAGVGKSRLAVEFLEGLGASVVSGRCLSYGEGITYWPVVEVVKQLLGAKTAPGGAIAALLGSGQAATDEVAVAVRKLVEEAALERPLVVVFDDIQWGEPAFLDLIEHIADWSRGSPILLLCLARPELLELRPGWGGGKLNATTVLLEPLSAGETDELIAELLEGRALGEELRERIRSAAEGNPLFVEQMLAMVEESPEEITVPPTIQALLAARLDQLPAGQRGALERGSVEGQVFHRGAVAALAPEDSEVSSELSGLVRKELVRPTAATFPDEDAFRFRHLLIRDAAYDALPKTLRSDLHERLSIWLEGHAPELVELDEILGYHLEQAARYRLELGNASPGLQERAAERLGAAGLRAEARADPNAAVTLLLRASALLEPRDPRRFALLPALAQAYWALGRLEDAYRTFDEAIAGADPDLAAYAYFLKAFAQGLGDSISPFRLERDVRDALSGIERSASDRTLAAAFLTLGWTLFWGGRLGDAIAAGERAIAFARRTDERSLEVGALRLVSAAKVQGDVPWSTVEQLAAEMSSAGVDASMVSVWAQGMQGNLPEARRISDAHMSELRERGQMLGVYTHMLTRAEIEQACGELARAEQTLREGWDGLGALGERGIRSTTGGCLGELLARRGSLTEAASVLDEAMEISTPDDWVTVSQVMIARAFIASMSADHAAAAALSGEAAGIVDQHEYLPSQARIRLSQGEILLAAGSFDEACTALERARDLSTRKGSTVLVTRVNELLARIDPQQ